MRATTAKTKNVMAAFDAYQTVEQAAQEGSPAMALFSGQAGLGKTTAGAYLFVNADGILVRCLKSDTMGTLLERLAQDLGLDKRQRKADMINFIVKELAITGKPLFIDEADYLADKTEVLETIRDIYDLACVPIVLIGYEHLPKKIKRLPQLFGRISQHVQFQKADEEDIAIMANELVEHTTIEQDLLKDLLDTSRGNFRRITTGLASIEKFAKSNGLKTIDASQWAGREFFPVAEL